MTKFKKYLYDLIQEKGVSLDSDVRITMKDPEYTHHVGFTYLYLIDELCDMPAKIQTKIRDTLIKIDYRNGDVFNYLDYLSMPILESSNIVESEGVAV